MEHDLFGKPVSTFPDHALVAPLHFGRRARQNFSQMRFRFGVALQPLGHCLAQMIECGFDERWQGSTPLAFAARCSPPAVDAFADCGQPVEHDIGKVAVGFEIGAAFRGDGVKLFCAFA